MKYFPPNGETKFAIDPIQLPKSNQDFKQIIPLNGIEIYDPAESKQRLAVIGKNLKLENVNKKDFIRLVDAQTLLGRLIVRKNNRNINNISLQEIEIVYSEPSELTDATIIDRSVVSGVKVSVPLFGSVESNMSTKTIYQLNTEIKYFPYEDTTSFVTLIAGLGDSEKMNLIKALELLPSNQMLYILRGFDVILSAVFSVTKGTKLTVSASAAIASVFSAEGGFAFQAKDSKYILLPEQVYNTKYEEFQSVGKLLNKIKK